MNWTEITVTIPNEHTETASAIANMTVPYGIYIEDYSDFEASISDYMKLEESLEKWKADLVLMFTF